jgi:hypothetical protein
VTDKYDDARQNARNWYDSIVEMVEALAQANANRDGIAQDSARDAITESVLSVEVRSDWYTLDNASHEPAEYRILLTTGGPALQLVGALNEYGEPETAELQMRDWGVPWQAWCPEAPTAAETLLTFARCFYFGE